MSSNMRSCVVTKEKELSPASLPASPPLAYASTSLPARLIRRYFFRHFHGLVPYSSFHSASLLDSH
eukprot:5062755-Pleurochrysis_carterae.AAC.1